MYTRKKLSLNNFFETMIFVCLFLASLNAFNRWYFFAFFAAGFFLVRNRCIINLKLNGSFVALLLLWLSWSIFSPYSLDSIFGIFKPLTYVIYYIIGYGLINNAAQKEAINAEYKMFYRIIIVLSVGAFTHFLLNFYINKEVVLRETIDFWTGDTWAATGQASLACLMMGVAIATLFSNTTLVAKLLSFVSLTMILAFNIVLAGRTLLILLVVGVFAAALYKIFSEKKGKIRTIIVFLLVLFVLIYAYKEDVFSIKTIVKNSPFYERFFGEYAMEIIDDARLDNKIFYLKHFLNYPWGGVNIRPLKDYAHDIFFDTYDEAGIFAFVSVISYVFGSFLRLIKCLKVKKTPQFFRQVVLCVYIIVYLEFMIEPILQGIPWFFAAFCMIDGAITRFLRQSIVVNECEGDN